MLNLPVQSLLHTWVGTHREWWPYWRPWRWWVCNGVHWEWWRWWCLIADEAKWGLGPGLPQCYAESSAKNGGFGAGEHSDQRTKQQAAAPSGTPTGTHKAHCTWYWKKCCWWWWWWRLCNKHHQWLLLELSYSSVSNWYLVLVSVIFNSLVSILRVAISFLSGKS